MKKNKHRPPNKYLLTKRDQKKYDKLDKHLMSSEDYFLIKYQDTQKSKLPESNTQQINMEDLYDLVNSLNDNANGNQQTFESKVKEDGKVYDAISPEKCFHPIDESDDNFSFVCSKNRRMNSYLLVDYLTRVCPLKYFNNTLYINNGEFYEVATKQVIIGILQDILDENEKFHLDPKNYNDAADLLLSRRKPNVDDAKLQKHCVLFENGLFDVKKWEFIAPKEDHIVLFKVNMKFDPHSTEDSPVFNKFLQDMSKGDNAVIKRFLEAMGYCFLPENTAKAFFVLGTAADTGKSTIANFLTKLIGGNYISHVALNDLSGTFDSSAILGKVLNCSMDLDAGKINSRSVRILKNATGNDPIMINIKFQEFQTYLATAKFIFGTNHDIYIASQDNAFWNRLVMIPFMHPIPKEDQDKKLEKKLWTERNSIMIKLLLAARNLILNDYIFSKCELADEIVNMWRYNKTASVTSFIRNCCIVSPNQNSKTHTTELYKEYEQYCVEQDFEDIVSIKAFSNILASVYNLKNKRWHNDSQQLLHGYEGISLKNRKACEPESR